MRTRRLFFVVALTAPWLFQQAARADDNAPQPEPDALVKLQAMVTNLGYTTTLSADKQHFYFDRQSTKYNYRIDLALSTDGELIYVYNYIDTFSAAQLAKVPFTAIMEYQNSGNFFFSMDKTGSGEDFYANKVFGSANLTPPALRLKLDGFVSSLDETDALWNTKLWK